MKHLFKLALCLLLALVLNSTYAQKFVTKGSLIGAGGLSFRTGKTTTEDDMYSSETKSTGFSINPGAMFFVIDDLGVGAGLDISSSKSSQEDVFESTGSSFMFGPIVRYYFAKGPFVQGSFTFGSGKSSSTSGGFNSESKYGTSNFEGGVGYSTRITETIFVDPFVGYSVTGKTYADSDATYSSGAFFISVGFTLLLISK